jgi:hypothetical protein
VNPLRAWLPCRSIGDVPDVWRWVTGTGKSSSASRGIDTESKLGQYL